MNGNRTSTLLRRARFRQRKTGWLRTRTLGMSGVPTSRGPAWLNGTHAMNRRASEESLRQRNRLLFGETGRSRKRSDNAELRLPARVMAFVSRWYVAFRSRTRPKLRWEPENFLPADIRRVVNPPMRVAGLSRRSEQN